MTPADLTALEAELRDIENDDDLGPGTQDVRNALRKAIDALTTLATLAKRLEEAEAEREDFRSCLAITSGKLMAAESELAHLKDRVARLEKLERKNLSTIHVTRWRLNEYGKSTAELDEAIRETEAFLALTTDSPGGAAALVTANNGGSDAG